MSLQSRWLAVAAVFAMLGGGGALAQAPTSSPVGTPNDPAVTRNSVQGDPGAKPVARRRPNAKALARSDKQAPGTENGNQPDRASAGGGAH